MPAYRAFLVDPTGQFTGSEDFDCAGDEDAIEQAQRYVNGCGVEVWRGITFIAKIDQERHSEIKPSAAGPLITPRQ
jgi:hypothetical protein